tara:strand:+ start:340 stop:1026 length:687 start_codon:yes stop_codon:yes gene_type:complete
MEYSDNLKNIMEISQQTDYFMVIISLLFCIFSSFILMHVYKNKSNSLSSKKQIAPIIPILSCITFLVILIVKSSLALSLGLVGALSVIRFRTPIKEPEDLTFLFLSIALGIGYGALQVYSTTIVFIVIIFIIWFFLSRRTLSITNDFNLYIEGKSNNLTSENIKKIADFLKIHSEEANITKIEKDENSTIIYFRVSFSSFEHIRSVVDTLDSEFSELKFSIYENKILD